MSRAETIAGCSLRQLAADTGMDVPPGQKFAKGWIGTLLEICLGASAASLPEPDFQLIGVELKTLPVNRNGRPRESTYICSVPLDPGARIRWEDSIVRRKLSRVLWVPVEAEPAIPLAQRRIGSAFLWSPDSKQETLLRKDWGELMDMLWQGELDRISAHLGEVLQIRPKAANAAARTRGSNAAGEQDLVLPRGFYLRTAFTREILQSAGPRIRPP